ncbi:MAG: hypothetical protein ACUVWZ_00545 [Anaerolineae bacterium]
MKLDLQSLVLPLPAPLATDVEVKVERLLNLNRIIYLPLVLR